MKKRALFLSLLSLVFIAGCGENSFEGQEDKNSTEAQQFDRSANLDSGNYQAVLNDPNATATDYAAAAMGQAGLNPVKLIDAMITVSDQTNNNDLGTITKLPINPDAVDELQTAKDKLITELNNADPTDTQLIKDLKFQITVTSLTSTLAALAEIGSDSTDLTLTSFNPSDGIDTNEADALGTYIANNPTAPDVIALLDIVTKDVVNVVNYLPGSGLAVDLETSLNNAVQGTGGIDTNSDKDVTTDELNNYLNNVLYGG